MIPHEMCTVFFVEIVFLFVSLSNEDEFWEEAEMVTLIKYQYSSWWKAVVATVMAFTHVLILDHTHIQCVWGPSIQGEFSSPGEDQPTVACHCMGL